MTLFSASGAVDFAKRVFERILKLVIIMAKYSWTFL
jgi:hypothetical protein